MLTEGLNGPEKQRRMAGDEGRAAGRTDAGVSGLMVTGDRLVEILRRFYGG
jgi:hypothetical protein